MPTRPAKLPCDMGDAPGPQDLSVKPATRDYRRLTPPTARAATGGHPADPADSEEPGRGRSLTVNPSLARLSVTSRSSWWMTQSPSPSPRLEVLPAAGTRPARRSAGPGPVS